MNKISFTTALLFICGQIIYSQNNKLQTGADLLIENPTILSQKNIALVVNQTSILSSDQTHLVDALLKKKIKVKKIFAPEHGFRGTADAGENIKNSIDTKTGIPILSLYGKNKKPTAEQLQDIQLVIFDIQDVGARFYTYISTLFYLMEACSEQNVPLLVLDRPNPNDFVDGPLMQDSLRSFVGIAPIPLLHGLTVGEFAQMVNGEKWLHSKSQKCNLTVLKMSGWKHHQPYSLPVKPSPNLPNDLSISLYPSLCLFEATPVSIGRGTTYPFQVIGYPDSTMGKFSFTPVSLPGFDKYPTQQNRRCYGVDLRNSTFNEGFTLRFFLDFYRKSGLGAKIFSHPRSFDQLLGNSAVRRQILEGRDESYIKALWQKELTQYRIMRKKYLLYVDK